MPENVFKSQDNAIKSLLLRFLRRFYYKDLTYTNKVTEQWVNSLVVWIVDLLANGFLTYMALIGIVLIFPAVQINLGDKLWQRFIILVLSGLIVWYTRETYRWFRIKYKGGTR